MERQELYDAIADDYTPDLFGVITKVHQCIFHQMQRAGLINQNQYKVLDFGVGDAAFLKKMQQRIPNAEFAGLDVSQKMLKRAEKTIPLKTIHSDIKNAHQHFSSLGEQDIVLAHFVNAFVPTDLIFKQASLVTKQNGFFSIATSTYDSFQEGQKRFHAFCSNKGILETVVKYFHDRIFKKTMNAKTQNDLMEIVCAHQFEIVEYNRLTFPIHFNTPEEIEHFAIQGGWFMNVLDLPLLPKKLIIKFSKMICQKVLKFPFSDHQIIDILLVKKRA